MTSSRAHLDDFASFIQASPSSFHAAAEAARRLDGGRLHAPRRDRRVADRARAALRRPRRRRDRVDPAGRRLADHAVPHRRRAHRLPRLQAQAEAHDRHATAGCRPASRSTAARSSTPGSTATSSSPVASSTRDGADAPRAHRPAPAHPPARDPPRPGRQRRGAQARPAAAPRTRSSASGPLDEADVLGHLAGLAGLSRLATWPATTWSSPTPPPPAVLGLDGELFAAGRMDNLSSTHAGLAALLAVADGSDADLDHVAVLAAFDHEEVGSATPLRRRRAVPRGRRSTRVSAGLGADATDRRRAFAASWCLSRRRRPRRAPELPRAARPREPAGRRTAARC